MSSSFDVDPNANQGPLIVVVTSCVLALAGTAVALRFVSRLVSRTAILWDDYLIVLALVLGCGNAALDYWGVFRIGMGTHLDFLSPDAVPTITRFLKALFAYDYFYFSSIAFTKYSILLFYWRVFHVSAMKLPLIIVGVLTTAWLIACCLTVTFQCNPISGFWTREAGIECLDITLILYGTAIPNIVMDFALIIIPLPSIWRLKLSLSNKLGLIVVFLLGGFVSGVSILRCFVISEADTTSYDVTWNFVDLAIWSTVEIYTSIICACLPSLVPLLRILVRQTRDKLSQFSSRLSQYGTLRSRSDRSKSQGSSQPTLNSGVYHRSEKDGYSGKPTVPHNALDDIPRHAPVAWNDAIQAEIDGLGPTPEPTPDDRPGGFGGWVPPRTVENTPPASTLAPSDELPFEFTVANSDRDAFAQRARRVVDGLDHAGYHVPTPDPRSYRTPSASRVV